MSLGRSCAAIGSALALSGCNDQAGIDSNSNVNAGKESLVYFRIPSDHARDNAIETDQATFIELDATPNIERNLMIEWEPESCCSGELSYFRPCDFEPKSPMFSNDSRGAAHSGIFDYLTNRFPGSYVTHADVETLLKESRVRVFSNEANILAPNRSIFFLIEPSANPQCDIPTLLIQLKGVEPSKNSRAIIWGATAIWEYDHREWWVS